MADWLAPFHAPKLEPAEFTKQKAAYVAEKGYTITVPSLEDIIHVKTVEPMSEFEEVSWKRKDWNNFSDERYEELKKDKELKRNRYRAMLASPTPNVLKNAGAILTSIDDCQDALTTLSVVGKLAIHFAPRIIGKALLGPVGWLLTASDILNLVMTVGRLFTMPMMGKRTGELATGENPFSKKAQIKRRGWRPTDPIPEGMTIPPGTVWPPDWKPGDKFPKGVWVKKGTKIPSGRITRAWPTKGNLLEVAQTTDQIFGIGLSLGPIVGFIEDVVTGGIRRAMGQPVSFKWNPPPLINQTRTLAAKVPKAALLVLSSGYQLDDDTLNRLMIANYMSQQELFSNTDGFNAIDQVHEINLCELSAPLPTNLLTKEVIEEEGAGPKAYGGWPHSNKPWAPIDDILNELAAPAKDSLRAMMEYHAHDWNGFLLGAMATGSHFYTMGALEGEDQVRYDYTAQSKFKSIILGAGFYPDPTTSQSKLDRLAWYLDYFEESKRAIHLTQIIDICETLQIKLLKIK